MSNVAIFRSGKTPQYLKSVHEPPYFGDSDVLIDPDVSVVQNVPLKHWKRVGYTIVEMNASEKQVIADAELQARKDQADNYGVSSMKIVLTALIKVINLRLPSNKITKAEMITALKKEIT